MSCLSLLPTYLTEMQIQFKNLKTGFVKVLWLIRTGLTSDTEKDCIAPLAAFETKCLGLLITLSDLQHHTQDQGLFGLIIILSD